MHRNDRLRQFPRVEDLEGRRLMTATAHLTLVALDGAHTEHFTHLSVNSSHQQGSKLTVKLPASEANASSVQKGDYYVDLNLGKTTYYHATAVSISVKGHGKAAQETIIFSYFTTNPNKLRGV